uniref:Uncharacterized protein n=1 Tax=Panagrolaimus sp. JU765 TaxID=591449 RepID=A0AC34PZI3_9BILA
MFLIVKYSNDFYDIIDVNSKRISGLLKAEKNKIITIDGGNALIVEMGSKKEMDLKLKQYKSISFAPVVSDPWAESSKPNFSKSKSKFKSSFNDSRRSFKSSTRSKPYSDTEKVVEEQANKAIMDALDKKEGPLFELIKARYQQFNDESEN